MNVSLTASLKAFIGRKVASDLYKKCQRSCPRSTQTDGGTRGHGQSTTRQNDTVVTFKEPELKQPAVRSALAPSRAARQNPTAMCVLVDIDPATSFDLFDLVRVKNLVADRLGRPVDIIDRETLKRLLRDNILAEASF